MVLAIDFVLGNPSSRDGLSQALAIFTSEDLRDQTPHVTRECAKTIGALMAVGDERTILGTANDLDAYFDEVKQSIGGSRGASPEDTLCKKTRVLCLIKQPRPPWRCRLTFSFPICLPSTLLLCLGDDWPIIARRLHTSTDRRCMVCGMHTKRVQYRSARKSPDHIQIRHHWNEPFGPSAGRSQVNRGRTPPQRLIEGIGLCRRGEMHTSCTSMRKTPKDDDHLQTYRHQRRKSLGSYMIRIFCFHRFFVTESVKRCNSAGRVTGSYSDTRMSLDRNQAALRFLFLPCLTALGPPYCALAYIAGSRCARVYEGVSIEWRWCAWFLHDGMVCAKN